MQRRSDRAAPPDPRGHIRPSRRHTGPGRIPPVSIPTDVGAEPQWPRYVVSLCEALRTTGGASRTELRARLWNLLRDGLLAALRREISRFRHATREDLEDLASAKALDLLSRAERGDWDPSGRADGEVVAYIRSTARHGLLRLFSQRSRLVHLDAATPGEGADAEGLADWSSPMPSPECETESDEFASALLECLSHLQPRARFVWFLRAVHDLGSRDISAHPDVRASIANVDVILMRARAHLKSCLAERGLESGHLPPGTFTLVWDRLARGAAGQGTMAGARDR